LKNVGFLKLDGSGVFFLQIDELFPLHFGIRRAFVFRVLGRGHCGA
jgi:hypothetical protein